MTSASLGRGKVTMSDKKQCELRCFDTTMEYVRHRLNSRERDYFESIFPSDLRPQQSERPDFIMNSQGVTYLIEHFLIDFCYDGPKNNQSRSKRENRAVKGIYDQYHDPTIGTIKEEDKEAALSDIETEINRIVNISNIFNYDKYMDAYIRVYSEHYNRIESYKKNTMINNNTIKMGFLIEFHCETFGISAMYNGGEVRFHNPQPAFPMTNEIINLFSRSEDLDFIIVSQYMEGLPTEAKYVRAFEPGNIKRSIDVQRIKIYEKVFYHPLNKELSLVLENATATPGAEYAYPRDGKNNKK